MTADLEIARDGVEAVARFYESEFLRGTPFHLGPCGGCGAPSFGQPCVICNFYPMGSDKGIYSPHEATFDNFSAAVDRSGPYGQSGNIATWYLASLRKTVAYGQSSFAGKVSEAIKKAAKLELPSADLYWRVASRPEGGQFVSRHDRNRIELAVIWSASDELFIRTSELASRGAVRPDRVEEVTDALREWVSAAHDGDDRAILAAAEELQVQCGEVYAVTRDGNVYHAANRLQEEIARLDHAIEARPGI